MPISSVDIATNQRRKLRLVFLSLADDGSGTPPTKNEFHLTLVVKRATRAEALWSLSHPESGFKEIKGMIAANSKGGTRQNHSWNTGKEFAPEGGANIEGNGRKRNSARCRAASPRLPSNRPRQAPPRWDHCCEIC